MLLCLYVLSRNTLAESGLTLNKLCAKGSSMYLGAYGCVRRNEQQYDWPFKLTQRAPHPSGPVFVNNLRRYIRGYTAVACHRVLLVNVRGQWMVSNR